MRKMFLNRWFLIVWVSLFYLPAMRLNKSRKKCRMQSGLKIQQNKSLNCTVYRYPLADRGGKMRKNC